MYSRIIYRKELKLIASFRPGGLASWSLCIQRASQCITLLSWSPPLGLRCTKSRAVNSFLMGLYSCASALCLPMGESKSQMRAAYRCTLIHIWSGLLVLPHPHSHIQRYTTPGVVQVIKWGHFNLCWEYDGMTTSWARYTQMLHLEHLKVPFYLQQLKRGFGL